MFDIAWSELLIVVALAIIVVGPKDLPRMMRSVGGIMRKVRAMAREFQSGMIELARDTEFDEVQKSINEIRGFTPKSAAKKLVDPEGALDEPLLGGGFMAEEMGKDIKASEAKEEEETTTEEAEAKPEPEVKKDGSDE